MVFVFGGKYISRYFVILGGKSVIRFKAEKLFNGASFATLYVMIFVYYFRLKVSYKIFVSCNY